MLTIINHSKHTSSCSLSCDHIFIAHMAYHPISSHTHLTHARGYSLCGRRSTQSLQKGLRRASSPLGRGFCFCGSRGTQSLHKSLRRAWSAGTVLSGCGACSPLGRGFCFCGSRNTQSLQKGLRRAWSPRLLFLWQAQYAEPPERVAARRSPLGRGFCGSCGIRRRENFALLMSCWLAGLATCCV